MSQTCLPLEGATRCGYCSRRLVLQPAGDWACARCRPLLAQVRTVQDWARFQREVKR